MKIIVINKNGDIDILSAKDDVKIRKSTGEFVYTNSKGYPIALKLISISKIYLDGKAAFDADTEDVVLADLKKTLKGVAADMIKFVQKIIPDEPEKFDKDAGYLQLVREKDMKSFKNIVTEMKFVKAFGYKKEPDTHEDSVALKKKLVSYYELYSEGVLPDVDKWLEGV